MRKTIKAFLLSAIISLVLFSSFSPGGIPEGVHAAEPSLYAEKIVAVVYDNSNSMTLENRSPYAKYALQGLMSIFNSDDTMSIFPLNPASSKEGISVNLSSEDREAEVNRIITNGAFEPTGGTPPDAVTHATNWLESKGMNKLETVAGKEYWLIVLSDGEFHSGSETTSDVIRKNISGYIGLQTIYFGISAKPSMHIDDLEAENSAVTAYYTSGTADIISEMRELSNQVTGRYTLPSGVSINGKQVTIDLSQCNFSISSIAVLAESTDANQNISLTKVDCSTVPLKNVRACSIGVHEKGEDGNPVNISGYSSVIIPSSSDGYLNKDTITLTFNTDIKSLSVLVEPSIKLASSLQFKNGGGSWEDVEIDTINTSFKNGERVRTNYRLLDGKTGYDLTSIFNDVEVVVSYSGKTYGYDQDFALETGKKEVNFSVTIIIGESKYVLYNSWLCDIDENPTSFRIESNVIGKVDGDDEKVRVDYTVYYDNKKLTASDFDGSATGFKWELVELKDPQGMNITYEKCEIKNDGTISITYGIDQTLFGDYTCKIKVVCQENKRYRYGEGLFALEIKELSLATSQSSGIILTTNQMKGNGDPIEFSLTAGGQPLPFATSSILYELKVGGVDLTNKTEIDGNVLKFKPNNNNLPSSLTSVGDKNVELRVWYKHDSKISASISSKIKIIDSTYLIDVTEENNQVDIYSLTNCNAKLWYRVNLDGEYLSAKELQDGLDNGSISINYNGMGWTTLLPAEIQTEVIEKNGSAYIVCSLNTTWWKSIASLTGSLIITGEKEVTLKVADSSNSGTFILTPVSIFSRIWRWIVIILIIYLIIHIILWVVGFFVVRAIPKGLIVDITVPLLTTSKVSSNAEEVNFGVGLKIKWHLKRLIPFKVFMNQPEIKEVGPATFFIDKDSKMEMMHFDVNVYEYDISDKNDAYLIVEKFREECEQHISGNDTPSFEKRPTSDSFKKLFFPVNEELIEAETKMTVNESYYVVKDSKGKIKRVIFFIQPRIS